MGKWKKTTPSVNKQEVWMNSRGVSRNQYRNDNVQTAYERFIQAKADVQKAEYEKRKATEERQKYESAQRQGATGVGARTVAAIAKGQQQSQYDKDILGPKDVRKEQKQREDLNRAVRHADNQLKTAKETEEATVKTDWLHKTHDPRKLDQKTYDEIKSVVDNEKMHYHLGSGRTTLEDIEKDRDVYLTERRLKDEMGERSYNLYKQYIREIEDAKATQQMVEETKGKAKKHGLRESLKDVAVDVPASIMAFEETPRHLLMDEDKDSINTNSQLYRLQNYQKAVEEQVNQNIEDKFGEGTWQTGVGQFAYGVGMSTGKMIAPMVLGGVAGEAAGALGAGEKGVRIATNLASLPQFGMSAYSSTLKDSLDKGYSPKQAYKMATVAGLAEMGTEVFSMDAFWDIARASGSKIARNQLVNWLVMAGIEGSEEGANDVINEIADIAINGDQSEYYKRVDELIRQGYSAEQANHIATAEFWKQAGLDMAAGAVAGGLMGGAATGLQSARTAEIAKYVDNNDYMAVIDMLPTEESRYENKTGYNAANEAVELAQNLAYKTEQGETVSKKEKKTLVGLVDEARSNMVEETKKTKEQVEKENGRSLNDIQDEVWKAKNAQQLTEAYHEAVETVPAEYRAEIDNAFNMKARALKMTEEQIKSARMSDAQLKAAGYKGVQDVGHLTPKQLEVYREGETKRLEAEGMMLAKVTGNATAEGKKVTIKGIDSVTDTDMILQTDNGTISASKVEFDNKGEQYLYNKAAQMDSVEMAKAYVDNYVPGMAVRAYNDVAQNFYAAGQMGLSFENQYRGPYAKEIGEKALRQFYDAGKNVKQSAENGGKKVDYAKKGSGKVIDKREQKNKTLHRGFLGQVAEKFGVDIELTDKQTLEKEYIESAKQRLEGLSEKERKEELDALKKIAADTNGSFEPALGKIVLNTDNNMFATLMHELGEFGQAYNPKAMEQLRVAVLEYVAHVNPDALRANVIDYKNAYQRVEGSKTLEEASEELFNDCLSALFATDEGIKDFVNWTMDNRSEQEAKSIIETLAKWIKEFCDAIKAYLGSAKNNLSSTQTEILEMDVKRAEELRKKVLQALDEAIATRDSMTDKTGETEIRYSIKVEPERVFYTKAGVEVVQNPTAKEYNQMREDMYKERPWLRDMKGEPLFRHTYDEQGNEYYWDAAGGLHSQVEPEINKKYNTRTSQQWQWWTREDKDDYPTDYGKRFSLNVPVEENDNLIAVHNLHSSDLMETLELGGFPMPSIAVTKASMGHDMFGNVSVLFKKDTIDPKKNRNNKVYSGDAYTPTFPQIGYKVDADKIAEIRDHLQDILGDDYNVWGYMGLDTDNATDYLERNRGNVVDAFGNKDGLKAAFAKDTGKAVEVPKKEANLAPATKFTNDEVKYIALMFTPEQALRTFQDTEAYKTFEQDGRLAKIIEKINAVEKREYGEKYVERFGTKELSRHDFDVLLDAINKYYRDGVKQEVDTQAFRKNINEVIEQNRDEYEKWLRDLFDGIILERGLRNQKDLFTPSGNRRNWNTLYDPYNLDNIVKLMRSEPDIGANSFGGYSIFGSSNREFESIKDIHSEEGRLQQIDADEYSKMKDEIQNDLYEVARRLVPSQGWDAYSIAGDIAEAVSKKKTASGIKSFLSQWYKPTDEDISEILDIVRRVNELPTGYFEAKPRRAVGFDEIANVIVPDTETELMKAMDEKNIPYTEYKAGDKESRREAVNKAAEEAPNARFSIDVQYDEAYQSGDVERMQQLVDEAARAAGFDSPNLYHGTKHFGFNRMDLQKMDDGRTIFLTSNPNIASTYSGTTQIKRISEGYTGNPFELSMPELEQQLNANLPDDGIERQYVYYNRDKLNALKAKIDQDVAGLGDIINNLQNLDEQDKKVVDRLRNTLAIFPAEEAVTNPKSNLGVDLWFLATKTLNGTEQGNHLQELEANIRRYNTVNDEMEAIRKYNESPATEITQPEELILEDMLGGYSVETMNQMAAAVTLRENAGQGIYSLYAKLGRTLEIDGKQRYWNSLYNWTRAYTDMFNKDNTRVEVIGNTAYLFADSGENLDNMEIDESAYYKDDIEFIQTLLLSRMPEKVRIKYENLHTTRDITAFAKEHGFDSVVFKNIKDNGGRSHKVSMDETADVYAIFNPNNVKSADPVTLDDKGEIIPPSERFRDSTDDMRYSLNVFAEQYDAWDKKDPRKTFVVGHTSTAMALLGIKDADIIMNASKIMQIKKDHPEMNDNVIKQIPKIIDDPVIIMDSRTVNGRKVLFGDVFTDTGKAVMIALELNATKKGIAIDDIVIASAYERKNDNIQNLVNSSVIRYINPNKKKTNSWLKRTGVQFPVGLTTIGSTGIISQKGKNSNKTTYSLKVDTEGRELTEGQKEFFAESKIVDKQGRLKVMYHGSPDKGFTVFDKKKAKWSGQHGRGFYFSDSKTHSGDYGELYEVYLNIKHPVELGTHDITKEQFRKFVEAVAENEDYGLDNYGYGATVDSVVNSVWGKEDYSLMMDVNASCIGDYVEAVKLFNEVNGTDYDGIVAANETVAFEPNQIKEVTNENPTDNVDIRLSLNIDNDFGMWTDEDLQGTFIDEDGNVIPMGQAVVNTDDIIKGLARYLQAANEPLKGHKVNDAALRDIANQLKGEYQSVADTEVVVDNLRKVFDYMQTEDNINYNEITKLLSEVTRPIIEQSGRVDESQVETYQKFIDYLKAQNIAFTDAQKKQFDLTPYGSYNNFRKAYFGTLNLQNNGIALDNVWSELVEQARGFLDAETAEEDMGIALADAITAMKPQAESLYGYDAREASVELAGRIMEAYYEAEQKAITEDMLESGTAGTQAKAMIDVARKEMREEIRKLQQSSKIEYEKRLEDMQGRVKEIMDANQALAYDKRNLEKKYEKLTKQMAENVVKAKARQKTRELQQYIDAEEVKKQKSDIDKIAIDLLNRATKPTDKKYMPEGMRKPIAEFLTGIDFVSHRARLDSKNTAKWQIRMNDLRKYLADAQKQDTPDSMSMVIDPDLIEEMDQFINRNSEVNKVSQLKSWELKALHDILTRLRAAVNKSNEMFTNERFTNQAEFNQTAFRELREMNSQKNVKNFAAKLRDFFTKDLEDPVTYFSLMGDTIKTLFDSSLGGFDVRAGHIREAVQFMKDLQKNKEAFYKWSNNVHTFNLQEGTIEMTDAQIMSLYKTMQRQQAKGHILPSGFKVSRVSVNGKTIVQNKPVRVSPAEYLQIVSVLSQQQMEVADKMQRFMAGPCANWGNHTSMILYGYKKFNEENYFPIKTDANSRDATTQESTNNVGLWKNKNMSASKELVIGANNAIIIGDIFDVFADHVTAMATYDGMVLPQMDAMRWFNYREIFHGENENGEIKDTYSMKEEIERLYGPKGSEYFINLMLGINGMEPKARTTPLTKFIGNYKKAAVTAKIRVAIQQPTAIVRALDEMNGKYISKALVTTNFVKYSQKAQDKSMLAWWKAQGYYETYLGKDVKEMMVGKAPVAQFVDDAAGFGAQKADDLTWGALYHAVEYEIEDTTGLKPGTKEFDDAVVKRFEDVVTKTQVVDTMLHRTDIMRSQNELTKLATSFMAEPLKTYNMCLRSVMKFLRNPRDKKALSALIRTLFVYALNNAVLTAVTSAWDAAKDDDDKTPYWDRFGARYVDEFKDNLNPVNMLPYIKDAVEIIEAKLTGEYYSNTDMATEGFAKLATFVEHLWKRLHGERISKTDWGLTLEAIQAIQTLSGQPVYNVINDINTVHNAILDNWETKQSTSAYGDLHDAISKGKGIDKEVENLLESGKDKGGIKSSISNKFKEEYQTAEGSDKKELGEKIMEALQSAGYTKEEAQATLDKWDGKEPEKKETKAEPEEYHSDYEAVYESIDKNGNVQAEVQKMLSSGKQPAGVKQALTRKYKEKLVQTRDPNLRNTLVKAYMAAGDSNEEANARINSWFE